MAPTRQRVDKDTFKQIFRDHWEPFQQHQPRYQDRHVQAVIDKRLGCGPPASGYTTSLCPHGLEEKRVAFRCQSRFCLSCCKVYVDEWGAHIGRTLNSVRLNFCTAAELSDASGQYGRSIPFPWPSH